MKPTLKFALILSVAAMFAAISANSEAGGRKFHFKHGHRLNKVDTYLTEDLDATAQDPGAAGTMWAGSGLPSTNFVLRQYDKAGIELAIKAHYRQGADIAPSFVDEDGVVHVVVPAGHQIVDPAHGVPVAHTGRARWNFAFSYDVALDPGNPDLDAYRGWLLIDTDPSEKTRYHWLKLTRLTDTPSGQQSGYGWKSQYGVEIPDDEGTSQVTQNSQNLAFYEHVIDGDPDTSGKQSYAGTDFGPGEFDVMMILERGHHRRKEAVLHVVFDVVAP